MVKAGLPSLQNPLRGRNPSRRNVVVGKVSGTRQKAEATSGNRYNVSWTVVAMFALMIGGIVSLWTANVDAIAAT